MDWIDELYTLARTDENWLDWQAELKSRKPEFEQIMQSLTPEQQDFLREYLSVCQEAEYALVSIAYEIGQRHSRNGPILQSPKL